MAISPTRSIVSGCFQGVLHEPLNLFDLCGVIALWGSHQCCVGCGFFFEAVGTQIKGHELVLSITVNSFEDK